MSLEEKKVWRPLRWLMLVVIAFGAMGTVMILTNNWLNAVVHSEEFSPYAIVITVIACAVAVVIGTAVCWLFGRILNKMDPLSHYDDGVSTTVEALRWWQAVIAAVVLWVPIITIAIMFEQTIMTLATAAAVLISLSWIMMLIIFAVFLSGFLPLYF